MVTVDALGPPRTSSHKLGRQEADYRFAVTANEEGFADQMEEFWDCAFDEERSTDQQLPELEVDEEVDGGDGRGEIRELWWCEAIEVLRLDRK